MNSTPSRAFLVTVENCKTRADARKIAGLLRAFPYIYYGTADEPSTSFSMMVRADNRASIQTAIAPALGKADVAVGEMAFLSDNKWSSEPFEYMRFKSPTRPQITPEQT